MRRLPVIGFRASRRLVTNAGDRPKERALNVAFTWPGLQALGLDSAALESFPGELREGMTNAYRARVLGDHGESAPERWRWGGPANYARAHSADGVRQQRVGRA